MSNTISNLLDKKPIRFLKTIQDWGILICGLGSVALVCWFVISRYILKVDFPAFDELISISIFWFYYLGGAGASYDKVHIQADIVEIIKNKKTVAFLKLCGSVFSMLVLVYLIYLAFDFAHWNQLVGTKSIVLKIPLCISQYSIFVGCVFMLLYEALHFIMDIATYSKMYGKKHGETKHPS